MSYESVSTGFSRINQLAKVLQDWKKYVPSVSSAIDNLQAEMILGDTEMEFLLNYIIDQFNRIDRGVNDQTPTPQRQRLIFTQLKKDIKTDHFYTWMLLKGRKVSRHPSFVCTVFPFNEFLSIIKAYPDQYSLQEEIISKSVEKMVRKQVVTAQELLEEFFPDHLSHPEKALPLPLIKEAKKLFWVFWDDKNLKTNPDDFIENLKRENLVDLLRLDTRKYKDKNICFIFNLGQLADLKLHVPTFCDSGFNTKFIPADNAELNYGLANNDFLGEIVPEAVCRSAYLKLTALEKCLII